MLNKRTRLFVHFNVTNFFQILKNFLLNKKNFLEYLKEFLKTKNLVLTSLGRTALYEIIKIIIKKKIKKLFLLHRTLFLQLYTLLYTREERSNT